MLRCRSLIAAVALLIGGSSAMAGSSSGTLTVTVRVNAACTVAAATLPFGQIDNLTTSVSGTATVNVTCPAGQTYQISVPTADQTMTSGANSIVYRVGMNAALSTGTLAGQTGTGAAQAVTVYGQIPAAAAPAAGLYTGTVTVTVTY